MTRPFLKWAGGKRQLLSELIRRLPSSYDRYFEPFVGGGALLFGLQPINANISDANPELINAYNVVRRQPADLIAQLTQHENTKEYFLWMRALKCDELTELERASRLIYLNKTCFNGLYRLNRSGQFNVPFGNYKKPKICDARNILNCSQLLQNVNISCASFEITLESPRSGDFVYLDPPYVNTFTSYTATGFGMDMQIKLRDACDDLDRRGVRFLLSNSDVPATRELYGRYHVTTIPSVRRAINRGIAGEILVQNY